MRLETIQERNDRLSVEHARRTEPERRRAYWSAKEAQELEDRRREVRRAEDRAKADSGMVADWISRFEIARHA